MMPRGAKIGQYVTLSDRPSMQFRQIATAMSDSGYDMSHATARGIVMSVMQRLAKLLLMNLVGNASDADVKRLANDEAFQMYVGEVLDSSETEQNMTA